MQGSRYKEREDDDSWFSKQLGNVCELLVKDLEVVKVSNKQYIFMKLTLITLKYRNYVNHAFHHHTKFLNILLIQFIMSYPLM